MNFSERNKLAHSYYKTGDIEKAIELYELNVQLDAQTPATYNRLITIYRKKNDPNNQLRILRKLLIIELDQLKSFENADKQNMRYTLNLEKQKLVIDFIRKTIEKLQCSR